jgi:uncharacterized protein YdcH (DUF465 family)
MSMTHVFDNPGRLATHRSGVGVPERNSRAAGPRHPASQQRPASETAGAFACLASSRPRRPAGAGFSQQSQQEVSMFEGQPQMELDAILKANNEFRQLYYRHKELDKQVLDAELGVLPVDDTTLSQMKREKLAAKDRLTRMYDVLHH